MRLCLINGLTFSQTFEQLLVSWHNIAVGVYFAPGPMCDNS